VTRLLPLLLLVLLGCDPRAKVQEPFPTPPEPTAAATPADEHTIEGMVESVPARVDAIEQHHRALLERLAVAEAALLAVDEAILVATTPEQHQALQARAAELREAAHAVAVEATELRREAEALKDTSTRLRAVGD